MKYILIILLASCAPSQEIQVKSTYVRVLDISIKYRYGQEDELVFHLQAESGVRFMMERPLKDSARYKINGYYSFLAPR